jgi:hypothetical protein
VALHRLRLGTVGTLAGTVGVSRIPFRFAPIPHEMLFSRDVPPQVAFLWAAIYRLADLDGGVAAIGQVELGEKLGWSDDTVARWAKKGRDLGWIAIRRRGQGLPNEYRVVVPDSAELRDQEPGETRNPSAELRVLSSSLERSNRETTRVGDFDAFWKLYPRKTDKGHARAAYAKALKIAGAEIIHAGLERCVPALRRADPQFVPHAATWLNGERWEDELGATKASDRAYVPPLDADAQLTAALARMEPAVRAAYEKGR